MFLERMMGRFSILMYHSIDVPLAESEARFCCLPERFAEQMAWISKYCHPLSLNELLDAQDGKTRLPDNAVAVTFDDGFTNVFENAMPILEKHKIPATMYIVASRIGSDNDWMHKRGRPKRALVDACQICEMVAAGIEIGSHTLNHARLPEIPQEQKLREITESKTVLEDLLSAPVTHFAYPYGLYDEVACEAVKNAGYVSACSTRSGFNSQDTDRYLLRRIEVFNSDKLRHFKQKLKFGTNNAAWHLPFAYYCGRVRDRLAK